MPFSTFDSEPSDEFEESLDLNSYVADHPEATYFVKIEGDSRREDGIFSGDMLVVDRAAPLRPGSFALAVLDGSFALRRAEDLRMAAKEGEAGTVWGVIVGLVRKF